MQNHMWDRLDDVVTMFLMDDIPSYTKSLYPRLYMFLDDYYSYLKSDNRFLDVLSKYQRNLNISTADEDYLDRYLLGNGFVYLDKIKDKRQFALFLIDFYASAGSFNSYQYLFRALFNTEVRIEYPREQLLIPSQANYYQSYFIFTSFDSQYSSEFEYIQSIVTSTPVKAHGLTSKLEAQVESIEIMYTSDKTYLKIGLYPPQFEFNVNEVVEISFNDIGFKEYVKPILNVNIKNKGNLYKTTDKINIVGTKIIGSASISSISMGVIKDVAILDKNKIQAGDTIKTMDTNGGYGFIATVTDDKRLKIYNNGYDYTSIPKLTINNSSIPDGILSPIPFEVGGVKVISFDTPFVDYDTNDITIDIISDNGYGFEYDTYQNTLHIESGYRSYEGRLNHNAYLTDSYKYQQYSYLLVSEAIPSEYLDVLDKFLHTSGYIYFPVLELTSYIKMSLFNQTFSASIDEIETIQYYTEYLFDIVMHSWIYVTLFNSPQYEIIIQHYNRMLDFTKFNENFNHELGDYLIEDMTLSELYETEKYRKIPFNNACSATVEIINE